MKSAFATRVLGTLDGVRQRNPLTALLVAVGVSLWIVKPVGDTRLMLAGYALVFAGTFMRGILTGFWLSRLIAVCFMAAIVVGIGGGIIGMSAGNPGAVEELVFFVLLPIAWLAVTSGTDTAVVRAVCNLIPFAALFIGLIGVLYWADATGRFPAPWVMLFDLGQGIGQQEFGSELRFYPISSLVFVLPFLIVSLMTKDLYSWRISRVVAPIAAALGLLLLLVAGRRAIMLTLAIGVAIGVILLFRNSVVARERTRIVWIAVISIVGGAILATVAGFSLAAMLETVTDDIFSATSVRARSGTDLLAMWSNSPLIGNGFGGIVDGAARSIERPWAFELQYLLILNAVGVIGVAVLAATLVVLLYLAVKGSARAPYLVPITAGAVSLIVANASNPYMHTPGHYWMFFLLVAAVNASERAQHHVERGIRFRRPKEELVLP